MRAVSKPPPKAVPCIAAMTGLGPPSSAAWISDSVAPFAGLPNSEISAPAMKVRPAQITTMALTAGSPAAAWTPSRMPLRTSAERALTGGESIVSTAISPSGLRSVTELIEAIARSSSVCRVAFVRGANKLSRAQYIKIHNVWWGRNVRVAIRPEWQGSSGHRIVAGNRARDRRADGRTWRERRRLRPQGRTLPGNGGGDQCQIWRPSRHRHTGEYFRKSATQASGRGDDTSFRPDRRAGLQRRLQSTLRADAHDYR